MRLRFEIIAFLFFWEVVFSQFYKDPSASHIYKMTNGSNFDESLSITDQKISSQPHNGGNDSNIQQEEAHNEIVTEPSVQEAKNEEEKEICYPVVGCFSLEAPWKTILRPIGKPFAPEVVQTTLHFYSRENPKNQTYVYIYPNIDMNEADFDPEKITVIIAHGFSTSASETWMTDLKDAYLEQVDANVFIIDWGRGAQKVNYFEACANSRLVGRQLAIFVEYLKQNLGARTKKFHLIGHSLGAHIVSYIGKDVRRIGRLTALDPAQPLFEGFEAEVRLDKSDADFVDVIHTNAKPIVPTLGFGMMAPCGDVDFYVNGGFDQPGCIPIPTIDIPVNDIFDVAKLPVEVISKFMSCPHIRAYEIFIESLNEKNCTFWGHKADATNIFLTLSNSISQGLLTKVLALSAKCTKRDCIPLGLNTDKSRLRGSFVITTNAKQPYCSYEEGIPSYKNTKTRDGFMAKFIKLFLG